MKKEYIFPTRQAQRNLYYNAVVPYLLTDENKVRLGISVANAAKLTNGLLAWQNTMAMCADPNQRTKTSTALKNAANKELMGNLRTVYRDIPQSKLTDADRTTLNLQERSPGAPIPVPASNPVIKADTSMPLRHTVRLRNNDDSGKRAKPDGVRGGQIWICVGTEQPESVDAYRYLGIDTGGGFTVNFAGAEGGKTAFYRSRWENPKGETGPWSTVVAATVTA